jgi:hypothetical protein
MEPGFFQTFKIASMTTIYDELILLTAGDTVRNPEGAAAVIRAAANETLPRGFRRRMRDKTWHMILPEIPEGKEFSRDNFWFWFQMRFVWHRAWMGTERQKQTQATWLRTQRETAYRRGEAWPPKPSFRPIPAALPQPWTGKDERPGRAPQPMK